MEHHLLIHNEHAEINVSVISVSMTHRWRVTFLLHCAHCER